MTLLLFFCGLLFLMVLAYLARGPIAILLRGLLLAFQFTIISLWAAGCFGMAVYCLSGEQAMSITRLIGIAALLWGLISIGQGVGLFHSHKPSMEDTELGARFATRRELQRAGILKDKLP